MGLCSRSEEVYLRLPCDPNRLGDPFSRWPISELADVETHHPQTQKMQFETRWHGAGLTGPHGDDSTYPEARMVGAMNFGVRGGRGLDSPGRTL